MTMILGIECNREYQKIKIIVGTEHMCRYEIKDIVTVFGKMHMKIKFVNIA